MSKGLKNPARLKSYIEQLLENVAAELNVKEVVLERDGLYATYKYDTIREKNIGFDDNEWLMASLIFTGNILEDMEVVRRIVKDGLNQRAEAKVKVRQPLQRITVYV